MTNRRKFNIELIDDGDIVLAKVHDYTRGVIPVGEATAPTRAEAIASIGTMIEQRIAATQPPPPEPTSDSSPE
jgi:hypothetical protein